LPGSDERVIEARVGNTQAQIERAGAQVREHERLALVDLQIIQIATSDGTTLLTVTENELLFAPPLSSRTVTVTVYVPSSA